MSLLPDESESLRSSFQFPSNWVVEVAQYAFNEVRDGTHDSPKDVEEGVPLVTSKNLINGVIDFSNTKTISCDDHEEIAKRSGVSTGDLLFSMIGTIGNVAVVPDQTNFSVKNVGLFRKNDALLYRRYAFYWLKSQPYQKYLEDRQRGGNQKFVSLGVLRESPIPIPPLAEQKVIADKLDTLLTQVETTKAHLERIPKILKTFRQSVLAAAVSGKLVTVSEPNVTTVGCVTTDIRYGTSKKCDYDGGQTPVIRIPNIGDRRINLSDLKYADFTEKELEALALKAGDILVIRSNGSLDLVAKPALVDQKSEGFLYAGYLIRLRCNEEKVLPSFLLNVMSSRVVRDIVEITSRSTSGVNNINSKELASLKFVLPSIVEQTEIVRRVEELFTFADSIEQKANAALERVNNLTQSILAKAFRGELTADWRAANPELITGENSAEALLERIKAEREARSNKKPAVRKTRARKEA
ncbi:Type I restriction enzyme EcoKI specificity protein [Serratia liquefaciens]|nr:Type I restriction enzyme EcoKI specificity protein [Serratia liquefaciens]HDS5480038.1 restriction endonuclease subunit S [Serratia liquefaciens]